tara:strand:+ start:9 stop:704 length:696 start_codon:yes stop_codon:yes gene_type:complete
MEITYLVPCYNEEKNIEYVYEEIIKANKTCDIAKYEIILINDFSHDNTLQVFKKLERNNKNIKILNNSENLGLGGSLKKGFKKASMNFIMYLPGDNCHSSSEISKLLSFENNYDILLSYYSNKGNRPIFRRMFTAIYTPFLNLIFNKNLPYYNGIAIYKKNIINNTKLKTSSFTWQIELLIKSFKKKNIKLALVSTLLNERTQGNSKAFKISNCLSVIYSIFRIWLWNLFN